jgi:hypothetical protein
MTRLLGYQGIAVVIQEMLKVVKNLVGQKKIILTKSKKYVFFSWIKQFENL